MLNQRTEVKYKGLTLIAATVRGQWKGAIRDADRQLHTYDGPDAITVIAFLRKLVDQSEDLSLRYPTDTVEHKGLTLVLAEVGDKWIGQVRDRLQILDRREGRNRDEVLLQLTQAVDDTDALLLRHPLDERTYRGFSIRTIEKGSNYKSFVSYRSTEILSGELSSSLEEAVVDVVKYIDANPNILEAHLTANHRRMLKKFEIENLEQIGIKRLKEGRYARYAHCWACHHPIDNMNFHECEGCGWIVCFCGACGCSYEHRYSS